MICALLGSLLFAAPVPPEHIGNHPASFYRDGRLKPWLPLGAVVAREMAWYKKCPKLNGYPAHVLLTFMDGNYRKVERRNDSIPAMQCATGIISYLDYANLTKNREPWVLQRAVDFADYIIDEASTPNQGEWPQFPRSTGVAGMVPQAPDCGRQADHPYDVEPDKGAMFAYASLQLYKQTHQSKYLRSALHIANTMVAHMKDGDASRSPWAFRVDYRSGEERGLISADMGFPLALFDDLVLLDHYEFQVPKERLWRWIEKYQLPSLKKGGALFVNFFEDYDLAGNRNSWSAMNLARVLMVKQDRVDRNWLADSKLLVDFVTEHFTSVRFGVPVCGEQDDDKDPWGGALSTYGAVIAKYAKLTGSAAYKNIAFQALTFCSYAVDTDGCPGQSAEYAIRGGWQEDAHTDVIHNLVEAMNDFPEWVNQR